jgi:hypothetical protein
MNSQYWAVFAAEISVTGAMARLWRGSIAGNNIGACGVCALIA